MDCDEVMDLLVQSRPQSTSAGVHAFNTWAPAVTMQSFERARSQNVSEGGSLPENKCLVTQKPLQLPSKWARLSQLAVELDT